MMNKSTVSIEQIYTGCLAQGAYYITSNGEAAIIDPLRETQPYIDRLMRDGVTLKYIFETHFHADFVSGHLDLSYKTNAPIVYGPGAKANFNFIAAQDNQEFVVGDVIIQVLHTPGHTMESACFLLKDHDGIPQAVFTGDTLFIGDVGRPDLAQKAANLTQQQLAGLLYHSLRSKIMSLPDDVVVYPAHGAGSACGKNMSKETVSTIGQQKKLNYALRENMTEEEFIHEVTDGLLPPPVYFGANVAMNKSGYKNFETILENGLKPLNLDNFIQASSQSNVVLLDTRDNSIFYKGFIPMSINIGLRGDFAPWVGALIGDVNQPIVIITEPGFEEETITRLSRVGFDNIIGYLEGGFETWKNAGHPVSTIKRISAQQFAEEVQLGTIKIIDVRKESEYRAEHVEDAINRPLAYINTWMDGITNDEGFYLHCAGGYRSMVAASMLQARGIYNFREVEGGFTAITKTSIPTTEYVCTNKVPN